MKITQVRIMLITVLAALGCIADSHNLYAQTLYDPTLPPSFLRNDGADKSPDQDTDALPTIQDLSLQALILNNGNSYAIVEGVTIKVGSSFKGWKVTRINAEGALFQSSTGTHLVKMHPAVSKIRRP